MWVRHRSERIVPPEEGLEYRRDTGKSWCFIDVRVSQDYTFYFMSGYAKLIVNFSHESDVTSQTPFYFIIVFRIKYEEVFSYKPNADTSHLLDSLVSALAVYATAFRSKLSLE